MRDISEKVTEKNKDKKFTETFTNSAEYGIVPQNDFFDKVISNSKNISNYYIVQNDDFVYNPRISNFAPVGPIKRNKLNKVGIMSPLYYVFRTKNIDLTFLEKFFDTSYWHRFMKLNGDTGARADRFAIKDSVFKEMPIPYPSSDEQAKIGNLLKQIDNIIALHQRKLEKLQELKKAALQSFFPKKDEVIPKVRFTNFEETWEQCKLKDVIETELKGKAKAKDKTTDHKNLYLETSYLNGGEVSYVDIPSDVDEEDVLILWDGSQAGTVYHGYKGALGSTLKAYKPKGPGEFMYQYLKQNQQKIYDNYRTPNIPHVVKTFTEDFHINVTSIAEQRKLSSFFKQLDSTINFYQIKLEKLQLSKKAFLQKMFI